MECITEDLEEMQTNIQVTIEEEFIRDAKITVKIYFYTHSKKHEKLASHY